MAIMMRRCMASSRSYGRLVAMIIRPSCLGREKDGCTLSVNDYCTIGSLYIPKFLIPFNFSEEHVDIVASFLPALKDGLALVKEQNGVVDFGLAEDELEVLAGRHAPQRWEVDQENLYPHTQRP